MYKRICAFFLWPVISHILRAERILRCAGSEASLRKLEVFLDGFPEDYYFINSPRTIGTHYRLYWGLKQSPVQVQLQRHFCICKLTIVTQDRPALLATISGVLAERGKNIFKASTFTNAAGVAAGTFYFNDLRRNLKLNPTEIETLRKNIMDAVSSRSPIRTMPRNLAASRHESLRKVGEEPQVLFDDSCSSDSTRLKIIAPDHPGLLFQISWTIFIQGCSIEGARIDTQDQTAIDVFDLTTQGTRINATVRANLLESLQQQLR
jgi:[protein-PII] uridylyltransferase